MKAGSIGEHGVAVHRFGGNEDGLLEEATCNIRMWSMCSDQ